MCIRDREYLGETEQDTPTPFHNDKLVEINRALRHAHLPMTRSAARDRPGHYILWLLGVAVGVVPFFAMLIRPEWRAIWFLGTGHFADNIIIAGRVFLIGATLGGWAWFFIQRAKPAPVFRSWWRQGISLNWIWFFLSFLIYGTCLLYTSPSPRDRTRSRMPSSA